MVKVHRSVLKRERTNEVRNLRNRSVKSRLSTLAKRVEAAVADGDLETAEKELKVTVSAIDKACKRNIIKENTAARRKSRLSKLVNGLAPAPPAKEEPQPETEASE